MFCPNQLFLRDRFSSSFPVKIPWEKRRKKWISTDRTLAPRGIFIWIGPEFGEIDSNEDLIRIKYIYQSIFWHWWQKLPLTQKFFNHKYIFPVIRIYNIFHINIWWPTISVICTGKYAQFAWHSHGCVLFYVLSLIFLKLF